MELYTYWSEGTEFGGRNGWRYIPVGEEGWGIEVETSEVI